MDEPLDNVWRALADPTRRALLDELRDGPRTTGELVASVPDMTRFGVMKHLSVLEDAGLLIARKEGRKRWNHLNAVPLRRVYERWVSRYEDRWAGSLMNLKRRAEGSAPTRGSDMGTKLLDQPARVAVVETEIEINAPREHVFDTFFAGIGDWFYENEDTRRSQPTRVERRVGGHLSMVYPNGDENMIAWITMIKEGKKIRLRGDCTMPSAAIMNMTVAFEDAGAGCRVSITHRMAGEFADGDPAEFEAGWADGLSKLKTLCER